MPVNGLLPLKRVTASRDPVNADTYARASEWVYGTQRSSKSLQDAGLGDWTADPSFQTDRFAVLHHLKSNRSLLVHRGTNPEKDGLFGYNTEDLGSDASIVARQFSHSGRFAAAKAQSQAAMQAHPERQWETTGHSLGGTTAHYVGNALGINSHAINPGHAPTGLWDTWDRRGGQHHIYHTKGDILSQGAVQEHQVAPNVHVHIGNHTSPTENAHSTANWTTPAMPQHW